MEMHEHIARVNEHEMNMQNKHRMPEKENMYTDIHMTDICTCTHSGRRSEHVQETRHVDGHASDFRQEVAGVLMIHSVWCMHESGVETSTSRSITESSRWATSRPLYSQPMAFYAVGI